MLSPDVLRIDGEKSHVIQTTWGGKVWLRTNRRSSEGGRGQAYIPNGSSSHYVATYTALTHLAPNAAVPCRHSPGLAFQGLTQSQSNLPTRLSQVRLACCYGIALELNARSPLSGPFIAPGYDESLNNETTWTAFPQQFANDWLCGERV